MKEHEKRMAELGKKMFNPPPKKNNNSQKKVVASFEAIKRNGVGFPSDELIRYYFHEYNVRNANYGLDTMPTSFNVAEAFFRYIDFDGFPLFEIKKEKDHIFYLSDFLNYVTSDDCPEDIDEIKNFTDEGVIYSFNNFDELDELTFQTEDKEDEYIISSVSLIRHKNEVSLLITAGKLITETDKELNMTLDSPYTDKGGLNDEYKELKGEEFELTKLPDYDDYWKTIVLTRIDLETKSIDVRYVSKEHNKGFVVATDDLSVFLNPDEELKEEKYRDIHENSIKKLDNCNALFELCNYFLHLPSYYSFHDDEIELERHPTKLIPKNGKRKLLDKTKKSEKRYLIRYRNIEAIQLEENSAPSQIVLQPSNLKFSTTGYWKQLTYGKMGVDKNDKPIHNRTWVTKRESWYESDNPKSLLHIKTFNDLQITDDLRKKYPNIGYIYVMRSAAHHKNVFKIGLASKSSQDRANSLSSSTSSPDKFHIVEEWLVSDCDKAEKEIHQTLDLYRYNPKREYFQLPYKEIRKVVDQIADKYEIAID
ncbi:GIY-YIG nuclease family protein [Aureispira sp. CCB-E]|uniref:GIY-YIG nuclease family protein n=1 Tax=Aureispira sp. CCB-E TaxID=3051121 RepID=UPI002868515F|nr:GIY-YIG nuclease family protein [Aureispira sp. CCB-E]WMX13218.1 GIY-YIG nuclease family protein [Aureispira sp. CCB-E]